MTLSTFIRRFRRPVAAGGAALIVAALVIGFATADVGAARFGTLWVVGMSAGAVLLAVLAAAPRLPIGATWPAFLVASWGVCAAIGPGVVGGVASLIGWVVAATCVVMAISACILHYDIAQDRPVSRL